MMIRCARMQLSPWGGWQPPHRPGATLPGVWDRGDLILQLVNEDRSHAAIVYMAGQSISGRGWEHGRDVRSHPPGRPSRDVLPCLDGGGSPARPDLMETRRGVVRGCSPEHPTPHTVSHRTGRQSALPVYAGSSAHTRHT